MDISKPQDSESPNTTSSLKSDLQDALDSIADIVSPPPSDDDTADTDDDDGDDQD